MNRWRDERQRSTSLRCGRLKSPFSGGVPVSGRRGPQSAPRYFFFAVFLAGLRATDFFAVFLTVFLAGAFFIAITRYLRKGGIRAFRRHCA